MIGKKIKEITRIVVETIILVGLTITAALPISCKITAAGIEIVGGDYTAPSLQNITVLGEELLQVDFSESVIVRQAVVSPVIPKVSDSMEGSHGETLAKSIEAAIGSYDSIKVDIQNGTEGASILFHLTEKTAVGQDYELFGVVEDSIGNSLCFSVLFKGFNPSIPKLLMTELHTGMASQLKNEKESNVRRLEYVEFLALSEGNLAGLEFCSSYAGEGKKYVFPPVFVSKGEVIVLHLRNWGEGCISEEGDDLNLAFSKYTGAYRDLWTDQTTKCIGDTTDVLVLRNNISGQIMDAVMYRSDDVEDWGSKLKEDYFSTEGFSEIYNDCQIDNGTLSTGLSSTKFLYRVNAKKIYEDLMNGKEIEYPVPVDCDSWEVRADATAGSI